MLVLRNGENEARRRRERRRGRTRRAAAAPHASRSAEAARADREKRSLGPRRCQMLLQLCHGAAAAAALLEANVVHSQASAARCEDELLASRAKQRERARRVAVRAAPATRRPWRPTPSVPASAGFSDAQPFLQRLTLLTVSAAASAEALLRGLCPLFSPSHASARAPVVLQQQAWWLHAVTQRAGAGCRAHLHLPWPMEGHVTVFRPPASLDASASRRAGRTRSLLLPSRRLRTPLGLRPCR